MKQKTILPLLLMGAIVASCDDDTIDQPKPVPDSKITLGALNAGQGSNDLPEGYRIKSIGESDEIDYLFHYDENGNLLDFIHRGDVYTIGGSPLAMKASEEDRVETQKFTTNSKGYVTKIEYDFREGNQGDQEGWEVGKFEHEISYNSYDQIVEITGSGTWNESEDGELDESESACNYTFKFTYSSTVLQKVEQNFSWTVIENGEKENFDEKDVYTFNYYGGIENKYYQYTVDIIDFLMSDDYGLDCEAAAYLGLFGKASSMLPSQIKYTEEEYENGKLVEKYESTHNDCTYSLNSYGAVSREGKYFEYTYTNVGNGTRAATDNFVTTKTKKKHIPHVRPSKARKERLMMMKK